MKTVKVNARGLACPQPVILSKKTLSEIDSGEMVVDVDSPTAMENVKRMAENQGCSVEVEHRGADEFTLRIIKASPLKESRRKAAKNRAAKETLAYLFDADFIGTNRELGKVLVNGFLNAITALPRRDSKIIFLSNGVKLTVKGSYVLEALRRLVDAGFEILICGTCLDFFKVRDKVQVGTVSNALEIMETLTRANKVIKF